VKIKMMAIGGREEGFVIDKQQVGGVAETYPECFLRLFLY
jgi:hypothetical protein